MRATSQTVYQVNDIMIRGYLLSVDQGSELKRVALGFGSGASELKTEVKQTTSIMALEKAMQDLNDDYQKGPISEKG